MSNYLLWIEAVLSMRGTAATAQPGGGRAAVVSAPSEKPRASSYPPPEDSRRRLERAGWSVAASARASGPGWGVEGRKGTVRLSAGGATDAQAWWRACRLAEAMLLLEPASGSPA